MLKITRVFFHELKQKAWPGALLRNLAGQENIFQAFYVFCKFFLL